MLAGLFAREQVRGPGGTVGLAPLGHDLPDNLTVVPLVDMAPSRVVAVWNDDDPNPLIRSFIDIALAVYRH